MESISKTYFHSKLIKNLTTLIVVNFDIYLIKKHPGRYFFLDSSDLNNKCNAFVIQCIIFF